MGFARPGDRKLGPNRPHRVSDRLAIKENENGKNKDGADRTSDPVIG